MTPKQKAEELLERMTVHHWTDVCDSEGAKQCALIAVDELINLDYNSLEYYGILSSTDYWIEVKQEIEQIGKKICNYCQKEISKYGCACASQF
jgi:hypothetical protein